MGISVNEFFLSAISLFCFSATTVVHAPSTLFALEGIAKAQFSPKGIIAASKSVTFPAFSSLESSSAHNFKVSMM